MKIDDPQRSREIHNMADNNIDEVAQQIEGVRLHDQNQNDNQQFDVPMDADIMGLPNLLIVTNVDTSVYEDEQQKVSNLHLKHPGSIVGLGDFVIYDYSTYESCPWSACLCH